MLTPRRVQVVLRQTYNLPRIDRVWTAMAATYGLVTDATGTYHTGVRIPMNIPTGAAVGQHDGSNFSIAAGHQPQFWAQYAARYPYYRVYSSAAKFHVSGANQVSVSPVAVTSQVFGVVSTSSVPEQQTVWDATNQPMFADTHTSVEQSPYVTRHKLLYRNYGTDTIVKRATKVAKWFGAKQREIVTDGATPTLNKYMGVCTAGAETAPLNQVWCLLNFYLQDSIDPGVLVTFSLSAKFNVRVTMEYNIEFVNTDDYVVDLEQAP